MAIPGPNSHAWRVERESLDVRALMVELEDRRRIIQEQSFHEGSWNAVFDEAIRMGRVLRRLESEWAGWYCKIRALVDAKD